MKFCAAELRSVDFYLANSEEELLKAVARLEKKEKEKKLKVNKTTTTE